MAIIVAAFLAGYMNKEAAEPTSYDSWAKDTGASTYYNAISDAEHRNRPGTRFIRAGRAGKAGTTAYGPAQVNRRYIEDFLPEGRYGKVIQDPAAKAYLTGLHGQSKQFAKHGNMKGKLKGYDPKYGYFNKDGTGLGTMGTSPEQQAQYKAVITQMMQHRAKKEFGGDWSKYLQAHRGRTAAQDPKYYKAYDDSLKKQYGEYIKRQAQRRQLIQKEVPAKVAQVISPTVTGA